MEQLGLKICNDLQNESVFMITHLVCAVLLMRQHYQLVKDIEKYVGILSQEIKKRNGSVFELDSSAFDFDKTIRCFVSRLSIRGQTLNEKRACINK